MSVDVVLAHFHEALGWAAQYAAPHVHFHIYEKGDGRIENLTLPSASFTVRRVANVGRESQTYLHHIVNTYDHLAPWTVFTQADVPLFGYRGHRTGGGHMARGVNFEDYLIPRDQPFYVATSLFRLMGEWNFSSSLRDNYDDAVPSAPSSSDTCPPNPAAWGPYWNMGWFTEYVRSFVNVQGGLDFRRFHRDLLREPDLPIIVKAFPQGARFAASASQIRRRPLAYYRALLDVASKERDPWAGYYLEWSWPTILKATCPNSTLPRFDAETVSFDVARRMRSLALVPSPLPDDGPPDHGAPTPPSPPPPPPPSSPGRGIYSPSPPAPPPESPSLAASPPSPSALDSTLANVAVWTAVGAAVALVLVACLHRAYKMRRATPLTSTAVDYSVLRQP